MDPDGSSLFTGMFLAVQAYPMSELYVAVIVFIVFLAFCAVFTLGEAALEEYSETKLLKMEEEGAKRARTFLDLGEHYARVLSNVRTGFVLSAMVCEVLALIGPGARLLAAWQYRGWFGPVWAPVLAYLVATVLSAVVVLIFGYLVPRHIAWKEPNRTAVAVAVFLKVLTGIFWPVSAFCQFVASGVLKLIGIDPGADPEEGTEDDIREMLESGGEKGLIPHSEREMITNIFEFDNRTAGDVMTHRTEIEAVDADDDIDKALKIAIEKGFSRIPVYEDTLDNVVGVLYAKDLLMLIGQGGEGVSDIRGLMRPALYVPESRRCRDLFREFQQKKIQIAVVIDEYGGTSGMVTMEDLLETIVGEIQDEYDEEEEQVVKYADDVFVVDGSITLEDAAKYLPLLTDDEADYDTLGGLLTDLLGRIPTEGEQPQVEYSGIRFTVLAMDERRIDRVKAEILPPADE